MDAVYKKAETREEIKNWVESNGGQPAIIDDPEVVLDKVGLRINWKGVKDEAMMSSGRDVTRNISWEEFFEIMDKKELDFFYSDNEELNPTWRYKFANKYSVEE